MTDENEIGLLWCRLRLRLGMFEGEDERSALVYTVTRAREGASRSEVTALLVSLGWVTAE